MVALPNDPALSECSDKSDDGGNLITPVIAILHYDNFAIRVESTSSVGSIEWLDLQSIFENRSISSVAYFSSIEEVKMLINQMVNNS